MQCYYCYILFDDVAVSHSNGEAAQALLTRRVPTNLTCLGQAAAAAYRGAPLLDR